MAEAIMEAPDDPDDPVEMTEDESGTLFFVLKTVIEVLHDAREQVEGRRTPDHTDTDPQLRDRAALGAQACFGGGAPSSREPREYGVLSRTSVVTDVLG